MRKGEATRARILNEAQRQAAVKGLSAVSLNDIAEAVGLSKSGLFKHFESKEAMQYELLDGLLERFRQLVWMPVQPLPHGRARLERIFELWLHWSDVDNASSGCPIASAGVELDDQPGPLRDLLEERQQRWHVALEREFKALRDPPLSNQEAKLAVFQMKSFVFGHLEQRRLFRTDSAGEITRAAFKALLDRAEKG